MSRLLDHQKGQTLIEAIIAIAIGTLIIAAILGLATRSNRNANFARSSTQASKLSQQGLEIIRNIETVNEANSIFGLIPGCVPACVQWSELYGVDLGVPGDTGTYGDEFRLWQPGGSCTSSTWCLEGSPATSETITNDNQNFTRRVFIADTSTTSVPVGVSNCHTADNGFGYGDSKQVTVVVEWTDPVGAHEAVVTSCINNLSV